MCMQCPQETRRGQFDFTVPFNYLWIIVSSVVLQSCTNPCNTCMPTLLAMHFSLKAFSLGPLTSNAMCTSCQNVPAIRVYLRLLLDFLGLYCARSWDDNLGIESDKWGGIYIRWIAGSWPREITTVTQWFGQSQQRNFAVYMSASCTVIKKTAISFPCNCL